MTSGSRARLGGESPLLEEVLMASAYEVANPDQVREGKVKVEVMVKITRRTATRWDLRLVRILNA